MADRIADPHEKAAQALDHVSEILLGRLAGVDALPLAR